MRHGLPEDGEVGVVATEKMALDRLEQAPDGRWPWHRRPLDEVARLVTIQSMPEGDPSIARARRLEALVGENLEVESPNSQKAAADRRGRSSSIWPPPRAG